MKALHTILKPVVTEKSIKGNEIGKYTFFVTAKSTKVDVKQAIKELYGVDVASVKIIITPEKTRIQKRTVVAKKRAMKKAVVTLKGKAKLDVAKVAKEPTKK